jgi:uncharacterized membrane protein YeaQ/YmgE (transglycosylase-associated protein family)
MRNHRSVVVEEVRRAVGAGGFDRFPLAPGPRHQQRPGVSLGKPVDRARRENRRDAHGQQGRERAWLGPVACAVLLASQNAWKQCCFDGNYTSAEVRRVCRLDPLAAPSDMGALRSKPVMAAILAGPLIGGVRRSAADHHREGGDVHWLWVIIIGFLAGTIAKFFIHGPGGFIVTTLLGIVGAIFASWLGQRIGWYHAGQSAGFIGAIVGAIIILAIYRAIFGGPA